MKNKVKQAFAVKMMTPKEAVSMDATGTNRAALPVFAYKMDAVKWIENQAPLYASNGMPGIGILTTLECSEEQWKAVDELNKQARLTGGMHVDVIDNYVVSARTVVFAESTPYLYAEVPIENAAAELQFRLEGYELFNHILKNTPEAICKSLNVNNVVWEESFKLMFGHGVATESTATPSLRQDTKFVELMDTIFRNGGGMQYVVNADIIHNSYRNIYARARAHGIRDEEAQHRAVIQATDAAMQIAQAYGDGAMMNTLQEYRDAYRGELNGPEEMEP
jgi:hypothetical protein